MSKGTTKIAKETIITAWGKSAIVITKKNAKARIYQWKVGQPDQSWTKLAQFSKSELDFWAAPHSSWVNLVPILGLL